MNFNNFTIKSQEAVQHAVDLVQRGGQQQIEPPHLFMGVMHSGENVVKYLFQKLNVNANLITSAVEREMRKSPKVSGGEPYLSREANDVLQQAVDLASKMGDEYVTLEHILLALFVTNNSVSRIMKDAGVSEKELRMAIDELRGGQKATSKSSEENYQSLGKYAIDLNDAARNGKLDPVIGRDEEIRRVLQSSADGRRTTLSSSASLAQARPPSSKASHRG